MEDSNNINQYRRSSEVLTSDSMAVVDYNSVAGMVGLVFSRFSVIDWGVGTFNVMLVCTWVYMSMHFFNIHQIRECKI